MSEQAVRNFKPEDMVCYVCTTPMVELMRLREMLKARVYDRSAYTIDEVDELKDKVAQDVVYIPDKGKTIFRHQSCKPE